MQIVQRVGGVGRYVKGFESSKRCYTKLFSVRTDAGADE